MSALLPKLNQSPKNKTAPANPASLHIKRESPESSPEILQEMGPSHDFGMVPLYADVPVKVQSKLTVNAPGDKYERQADGVADKVMRMPEPVIQRACACGGACGHGHEDQKTKEVIQTKRTGMNAAEAGNLPNIVHETLRSPGQPLDKATRNFMEPRFGHNFSQVRIHTDAKATESAKSIHSLAYTVGQDVVFGSGQFAPGTSTGRRLLAHELTHVIQQSGGGMQSMRTSGGGLQKMQEQGPGITHIQRQTGPGSDEPGTADEEQGPVEENDPTEVQDGDTPVNASSGGGGADEAGAGADTAAAGTANTGAVSGGSMLASGGPEAGDVIEAQTGGNKGTDKGDTKGSGGDGKGSGGGGNKGSGGGVQQPTPPPPQKKAPKKITSIDVDQAAQSMTVNWDDGTKETHPVSTGKGRPNTKDDPCKSQTEENCTPNGTFTVGSLGDGNTTNPHGDKMSWYVEFVHGRGIGIHNSQPVPGTPASHGCVRVGSSKADDEFAKKINKNVEPGKTTITVSGKAATKPWTKPVPKPKPKPKADKK